MVAAMMGCKLALFACGQSVVFIVVLVCVRVPSAYRVRPRVWWPESTDTFLFHKSKYVLASVENNLR